MEKSSDGSRRFTVEGAGGDAAFTLEPPFAVDSPRTSRRGGALHASGRARDSHVAMEITRAGLGFRIAYVVDGAWLSAKDRRFPVVVDPTVTIQPATQSAEFYANCGLCKGLDWGWVNVGEGDGANRGAFKFSLGAIPAGTDVTTATLGLYRDGCMPFATPCSGHVRLARSRCFGRSAGASLPSDAWLWPAAWSPTTAQHMLLPMASSRCTTPPVSCQRCSLRSGADGVQSGVQIERN